MPRNRTGFHAKTTASIEQIALDKDLILDDPTAVGADVLLAHADRNSPGAILQCRAAPVPSGGL